MNRYELERTLADNGHEPIVLAGRIVILPHAGRVIGLFPTDEENALWVDGAALGEAAPAGWPNYGGDRVWISPEQDTLIAEQPDGSLGIVVPPELDPAGYTVASRGDGTVELCASAPVRFRRAEETVDLEWTRRIEALREGEVRYATGGDAGLAAVGYRVITTLRAARPPLPEGVQPAIWSILQVPPDARITVPTHRAPRRIHAFIGKPVVEMNEEGVLACDVHTDTSFKFGLQIGDSRGVSVAVLAAAGETETGPEAGRQTLLVREFECHDRLRYSDVPQDDPDALGFVHQIYVDDGELGGFGELEHHSAYLREEDSYTVSDVSYTYAYRGSSDAIARVRATVLNQEVQA